MILTRHILLAAVAALAMGGSASAADMIGNCEVTGARGSIPIPSPANPGELTVQVSLPAPLWWNGDTADAIKDGMEYCMAAEIAWRAGYDKLKVVPIDWTALVTGKTSGYDLTLSEASITEDRKKVVDFSVPYFHSDIGVMTAADSPVDAQTIKTVPIGIQQGTTGAAYALDTLGITNYQVYAERSDLFNALHQGDVQAILTDTSIELSEAATDGGKTLVLGQYKTDETYAAIYPKDNPNNTVLDKIIQAMIDDGTINRLETKYLVGPWGKDPAAVPAFAP